MVILRWVFTPSNDWQKARDLLIEWRDAHPEAGWRVMSSITGKQSILVLDIPFENEDLAGIGKNLFFPFANPSPEQAAWYKKWGDADLDIDWDTRELWRVWE